MNNTAQRDSKRVDWRALQTVLNGSSVFKYTFKKQTIESATEQVSNPPLGGSHGPLSLWSPCQLIISHVVKSLRVFCRSILHLYQNQHQPLNHLGQNTMQKE